MIFVILAPIGAAGGAWALGSSGWTAARFEVRRAQNPFHRTPVSLEIRFFAARLYVLRWERGAPRDLSN
ncbi:MAG: hypothetical protein L0Z55_06130 [Planctomycetes bacterium]|nr:hypothetical protein [Planctomycetota bacterium]